MKNKLKIPNSVIGANGKPCQRTSGMCSCCGLSAGLEGTERGFFVWRANWADTDGVWMSRLCGTEDGGGCISEVKPMKDEPEEINVLRVLLGSDQDGLQVTAQDYLDSRKVQA